MTGSVITATPASPMDSPFDIEAPNCLIFPSASGSINNCTKVELPSTGKIILVMIISWILLLAVAYVIYWFTTKVNPDFRFNYWILLLILVLSGLIISLFI
jgi:hypothetical protein